MITPDEMRALTRRAVDALEEAVDAHVDFGGWLAAVLATVAARQGSTWALIARQPGSWEASLLTEILQGTVGYDDGLLSGYLDADEEES